MMKGRHMNKANVTKTKISGYIIRSAAYAVLLSCAIVGFTSAVNLPSRWSALPGKVVAPAAQTRTLTFADRVAYQRAIEEVYWSHRIWPKENGKPKPSLDQVMSQAQIEQKVGHYLRNSQLLEQYSQRPITPEQLQAEMDRMARQTKQPKVLRELFTALGDDPTVIAECLARPTLSDRLVHELCDNTNATAAVSKTGAAEVNRNTREQVKHGSLNSVQEDDGSYYTTLTLSHRQGPVDAKAFQQRPMTMAAVVPTSYTLPVINKPSSGCDDAWTATTLTGAPEPRYVHTAVWTGSEMIVWGGGASGVLYNTGGRYNPATDSWTATPIVNAPDARESQTAVWTGTEMIVWGGDSFGGVVFNTGGRYNPATNIWTPTSTTNGPEGRSFHTAVWTGNEMVVWGGSGGSMYLNTGGRYNPSTNTWIATNTASAPSARIQPTAVWTGSEMIVWGGEAVSGGDTNTGGRYNPSTDSWVATSTTNAPAVRQYHTAVWAGNAMIVWGGQTGFGYNGGKYDPGTDSWTPTSTLNAPADRYLHTAVWTGREMIIWGGAILGQGFGTNTGGAYNPSTNTWAATATNNAPAARSYHTAVWTGSEMIAWGGLGNNGCCDYLNTGGRYCPPIPPTLGNYPDTSLPLSTDTTVTPDAAPTDTTSITVSTSTDFKGRLEGDPTTGVVRVTDAHPAGTYTVTVTAVDSGGTTATRTFTLTVTTPVTCTPVSFAAATNFGAGSGPYSVAVGDFNSDGKQDLAVANQSSSNVSISLGDGAGSFSAATNFGAGSAPSSVAVGDFNGDGNQDLAVTNIGSNNVSILLGDGAGNFSAPTNFGVGSGPYSVAVGDFNGDGKQDLAIGNAFSDTVSILLGDGAGSFSAATNFSAGSGPYSVAVGDFNSDGNQDLAIANGYSNKVSILLGDGAGNFSAPTNFDTGVAPYSVAVGDFNGDGKQDLAVANQGNTVSILLGDGGGSFSAATNFAAGSLPYSVAVGDFNGDGKQDLAVANFSSNNVSIFLGDGAGSFSAAANFGAGTNPDSVAVGDFTGDGKQDLAVANQNSNNVSILLRNCQASPTPTPTATFTPTPTPSATFTPTPTATATFTPTPTATATFTPTATATATATPTATFTPPPTPTSTPTVRVTVKTNPVGRTFSVDGTIYSSTQRFTWASGSSHTIATTSPQSGGTGVQYVWTKWNDHGAISHTVAPTANATYTATFKTQYYLTMTAGTGGRVRPTSGWKNSGATVSISATPASGYSFSNWTGSGTGSYSGPNNPASITMGGPITEAATFTHN
jgi:FG-GAP-like repeat/Divergent InlB B-repeat domain/FG-GAP repeat